MVNKNVKAYKLVSDLVTQGLGWLSFPKENWRMSQESLSLITKTITRQRGTFASKIQWPTSSDLVPPLPSRGRTTSVAIPCQTPFLASVRLAHLNQIIQTSTGYSTSCLCLGWPWQQYLLCLVNFNVKCNIFSLLVSMSLCPKAAQEELLEQLDTESTKLSAADSQMSTSSTPMAVRSEMHQCSNNHSIQLNHQIHSSTSSTNHPSPSSGSFVTNNKRFTRVMSRRTNQRQNTKSTTPSPTRSVSYQIPLEANINFAR